MMTIPEPPAPPPATTKTSQDREPGGFSGDGAVNAPDDKKV